LPEGLRLIRLSAMRWTQGNRAKLNRVLPAVNLTALDAAILIGEPVCGFPP
jgi:hypothetical protein